MQSLWSVAAFLVGSSSMVILVIQSMISIDRDLRARQTRMKNPIL